MNDERTWRVGTHYGIHIYAEGLGTFEDEPIGTTHNRGHAEQIVRDHNALYSHSSYWVNPYSQLTQLVATLTKERDDARSEVARLTQMQDETRKTLERTYASLMTPLEGPVTPGVAAETFWSDYESRCD